MPSSHLILCHPLLLLPSISPSIRVFSNESTLHIRWPKYWSFSFNISPSKEHPGLISFRMDWLDLLAVQGTLKSLLQHHSSKASILLCSAFFIVQLSHPYITTGKTIALTRWTFISLEFEHRIRNKIWWEDKKRTPKSFWGTPEDLIGKVMLKKTFWNVQRSFPDERGKKYFVFKSIHLSMVKIILTNIFVGFCGGSDGKESTCNVGDLGLIPELGRYPGGGHGNPLQCSCLENPHEQRSLVGYSPWGHKEFDTTEQRSTAWYLFVVWY